MGSAPPTPSEDRVPAPRDSQGQVSSHSGEAQWENAPGLLTVCTLLGRFSCHHRDKSHSLRTDMLPPAPTELQG